MKDMELHLQNCHSDEDLAASINSEEISGSESEDGNGDSQGLAMVIGKEKELRTSEKVSLTWTEKEKSEQNNSVGESNSVDKDSMIRMCELKKSKQNVKEETSVEVESRPIRSKRAPARFKDSIMF